MKRQRDDDDADADALPPPLPPRPTVKKLHVISRADALSNFASVRATDQQVDDLLAAYGLGLGSSHYGTLRLPLRKCRNSLPPATTEKKMIACADLVEVLSALSLMLGVSKTSALEQAISPLLAKISDLRKEQNYPKTTALRRWEAECLVLDCCLRSLLVLCACDREKKPTSQLDSVLAKLSADANARTAATRKLEEQLRKLQVDREALDESLEDAIHVATGGENGLTAAIDLMQSPTTRAGLLMRTRAKLMEDRTSSNRRLVDLQSETKFAEAIAELAKAGIRRVGTDSEASEFVRKTTVEAVEELKSSLSKMNAFETHVSGFMHERSIHARARCARLVEEKAALDRLCEPHEAVLERRNLEASMGEWKTIESSSEEIILRVRERSASLRAMAKVELQKHVADPPPVKRPAIPTKSITRTPPPRKAHTPTSKKTHEESVAIPFSPEDRQYTLDRPQLDVEAESSSGCVIS